MNCPHKIEIALRGIIYPTYPIFKLFVGFFPDCGIPQREEVTT